MGLCFDSVTEKNALTDAGRGINVMAFGPYGGAFYNLTFNVEALRNLLTNTPELNYIIADRGVVLLEQPGAALTEIVRGNTMAPPQFSRVSKGYSNNIGNIVESNNCMIDPRGS